MRKQDKNYLQKHLDAAEQHMKCVWYAVSCESPEDRISYGTIQSIEALKGLLALVKTED